MKRIALYHLETLMWIARLGTFRAAAERLNTTQPAISARVREIEDQLGISIFRREGRNMVLTARGRRLVQECEPLWAGFEKALLTASGFEGATGVVRIGSGEIAAASCLPGFVNTVERDLPGVTLELELDLTARMFQQLLGGTIDLAFLAGPVASPGIRTAPIGSVGLVWAASSATAAAGGFARPLPVWSIPDHSPLHGVTVESLAANGVAPRSIATCNNVRTLIEIVIGGGGAAVFPEPMVRAELEAGRLVEVLPRPGRTVRFEAAIRSTESDPLVLELFRRAGDLRIDG
ncbi:transcriptional regulator, LysR family [Novosphingobium aromaticivorans DSM 12444]|uniref:Transcriptional regulator, LysR family n=1 Tax=Novosphingobium aromaticivorans (strain ATCC 700278 / DSM 12444 / CCUG 56034 / CIP 105152 / NBRC 16084 / F199) TaxID=279238 RepID=Q2GAV7_NOVAD|nr:LysR family transcriptional regulator [Novosphingobium aromaticivorans]ABD25016.1 transcriptional regulator, LysR family [Novosphingobium aromaticivorans DSM 12444]SCY86881.1 transcriptional regulator, LysR family [Novosphingobium aromaticivorans]